MGFSLLAHTMVANPPPPEANTALTDFTLSVIATGVGATEGALKVVNEKGFDIVGVMVIAACLGFGGGVVRDVLTGSIPPDALRTPWFTVTVIVCALAVILLHVWVKRLEYLLFLADALVLGLFGAVGAEKALLVGLSPFVAVVLGSIVSVAGGILADLLLMRRPSILQPGKPNALASLVGVIFYVVLTEKFKVHTNLATFADVVMVLTIRVVAEWKDIETPAAATIAPEILKRFDVDDDDEQEL